MKNILITGITRGIGKSIALEFAKHDYNIIGIYKNSDDKANELIKQVQNTYNKKIHLFKCDIAIYKNLEKTINEILKIFKNIDILINNAGVSEIGLIQDIEFSKVENLININLKAPYYITKMIIPSMIRNKKGKIINIASMWGEVGASCEVAYSMTKGGIISFTKALAKELAPSNIQVNAISPGSVNTDMLDSFSETDKQIIEDDIPLGRLIHPNEIAELALFLTTKSAEMITGQVISINGGEVI